MTEWRDAQLSELIDIKHGFAFKGEFFSEEPTGDILITPGNFAIGGGFQLNKSKFYNGPVPVDYVLNPGDVIVTMTDLSKQADTLGYSAVVPSLKQRLLHNQRIGKLIAKDHTTNLKFIAWLMRTRPYRNEIVGGATGSTVKHTSPGRILAHRFRLPPSSEQQAIVDVLEPIDNKIELNQRMNETLEGMAQAIFRDWFVDFGPVRRAQAGAIDPVAIMGGLTLDPAHAGQLAALFPAAFGDDGLPVGWSAGVLGDIAETVGETVNPTAISPDTPYFGLEHLPRGSITLCEWGKAGSVSSNKAKFRKGQVLFGKLRPYFHKVGIAPLDGVCSTDIVVLDGGRLADRPFVASCASSKSFVDYTDLGSTGTKMPRTSWGQMKKYPIVISPESVRDAFSEIAQLMHDKIIAAVHECKYLADTRDYLLPRLMSGTVRVTPQLVDA